MAKKSSIKLKCHTAAAARATAVDPACLVKAEEKLSVAWARAEAKGGCGPSLSEATVEGKVDRCVADLLSAFRPCGEADGECGGTCPPETRCFAIGIGCFGEPQPCLCRGLTTTTCQPTTSTTSTTPPTSTTTSSTTLP